MIIGYNILRFRLMALKGKVLRGLRVNCISLQYSEVWGSLSISYNILRFGDW